MTLTHLRASYLSHCFSLYRIHIDTYCYAWGSMSHTCITVSRILFMYHGVSRYLRDTYS